MSGNSDFSISTNGIFTWQVQFEATASWVEVQQIQVERVGVGGPPQQGIRFFREDWE